MSKSVILEDMHIAEFFFRIPCFQISGKCSVTDITCFLCVGIKAKKICHRRYTPINIKCILMFLP